jgi:hypothetical protein
MRVDNFRGRTEPGDLTGFSGATWRRWLRLCAELCVPPVWKPYSRSRIVCAFSTYRQGSRGNSGSLVSESWSRSPAGRRVSFGRCQVFSALGVGLGGKGGLFRSRSHVYVEGGKEIPREHGTWCAVHSPLCFLIIGPVFFRCVTPLRACVRVIPLTCRIFYVGLYKAIDIV